MSVLLSPRPSPFLAWAQDRTISRLGHTLLQVFLVCYRRSVLLLTQWISGVDRPARHCSHKRAIVTCEIDDTLEVVGDDGTVVELDDESTTEDPAATSTEPVAAAIASLEAYETGGGLIALGGYGIGGIAAHGIVLQIATTTISTDGQTCDGSGDDLILLTQKKGRNSNELVIKAKQSSDKIDERLSRIAEKLESSGNADRLEQFTARAEERAEREAERLQKILDRSDASKKKDIEGVLSKRKDLNDKPIKDRKPPSKDSGSSGGTGGSSGGGNSGGGNN